MPPRARRVFVSAVTIEFESARSAIADRLQRAGVEVREQQNFRHDSGAETLLRKLDKYIRRCHAIYAIVGSERGSVPPAEEADAFAHLLPDGLTEASYTQWELIFAVHYGKYPVLFLWRAPEAEVAPPTDHRASQQRFIEWLEQRRFVRTKFRDESELLEAVTASLDRGDWREDKDDRRSSRADRHSHLGSATVRPVPARRDGGRTSRERPGG